jgi:ribosomal protein S18 acetylase RimI-like enzyme
MDFSIRIALIQDLEQIVEIISGYYSKSEQTSVALNIPSDLYRSYAEHIGLKAIQLIQALIAEYEGKVIGYIIWEDYCIPFYVGMKPNPDIFKIIEPEIEFVEQLESKLDIEFKEYDCAKLSQAAVLPDYQNKGIATALIKEAINQICLKDYKYILADCTAENSWHILSKLGFEIVNEIAYSDFIFNERKPFGELSGKRRLVIKTI